MKRVANGEPDASIERENTLSASQVAIWKLSKGHLVFVFLHGPRPDQVQYDLAFPVSSRSRLRTPRGSLGYVLGVSSRASPQSSVAGVIAFNANWNRQTD